MKDKVKYWYDLGLWSKEKVYDAVPQLITADDYEEIVGEPYIEGQGLANSQDYQNALGDLGV